MQLLRFPNLVQEKIFGSLELDELLVLSFCSNRTKYLIECLQKNRFRKIATISYTFDVNYFSVCTQPYYSKQGCRLMFDMRKKVKPMQLFGIGSMISLCRWKNSQYDSSKYEYESSQEQTTVAKAVHSYLYQFFGSHAVYQVFSCIRPPSLEKIDRTHIRVPENTTAEELEACFTASPNQEFIQLNGYFNGNLCPNSAILGAEHLTVNSGGYGDEILLGFRGKRLECKGPFHDATIVQFLNEWKSNRGFHNLESLIINSSDYKSYDRGDIIKNMDVKQLDRPEDILQITWEMSHSCSYSMFSIVPPKSEPSDFRSRDYLIRDGDGEKVSISIENRNVRFALWKGNSCEIINR
ncbi:hypothetical protein CRE_18008 [Caenorhabditis remanei]|uniref:F-box domain-containing protein n=1 Tax=Caenorhabditis remanei TaxID=31234 RepID=E3MTS4_CAERE|nr:hypothetical protein CRE_18008 [Caenorhabditis remanei]